MSAEHSYNPQLAALGISEREFAGYRPLLYNYLWRRVKNRPVAEELVQDTYVQVLANLSRFHPDNFRGWVYQIARNLALNHQKRFSTRKFVTVDHQQEDDGSPYNQLASPSPEEELIGYQSEWVFHSALADLKPIYREAFVRSVLNQEEGTSVAEELGIPERTFWTRVHRSKKKLEVVLSER